MSAPVQPKQPVAPARWLIVCLVALLVITGAVLAKFGPMLEWNFVGLALCLLGLALAWYIKLSEKQSSNNGTRDN